MKILALETSAKSVSAAVTDGGVVRAYTYQNTGLTHSRTLMPHGGCHAAGAADSRCRTWIVHRSGGGARDPSPACASAYRPPKGLAWAADKPCCGVSTLEAMARNLWPTWTGSSSAPWTPGATRSTTPSSPPKAGSLTRLTPDRAIGLAQLAEELRKATPGPSWWCGDGAALCRRLSLRGGHPLPHGPGPAGDAERRGRGAVRRRSMAARGGNWYPPSDLRSGLPAA